MRIETGSVQFGSDWPCVVIRGDNAMHYAHMLDMLEQQCNLQGVDLGMLKINGFDSFKDLLRECHAGPIDEGKSNCQFLKSFEECKIEENENE